MNISCNCFNGRFDRCALARGAGGACAGKETAACCSLQPRAAGPAGPINSRLAPMQAHKNTTKQDTNNAQKRLTQIAHTIIHTGTATMIWCMPTLLSWGASRQRGRAPSADAPAGGCRGRLGGTGTPECDLVYASLPCGLCSCTVIMLQTKLAALDEAAGGGTLPSSRVSKRAGASHVLPASHGTSAGYAGPSSPATSKVAQGVSCTQWQPPGGASSRRSPGDRRQKPAQTTARARQPLIWCMDPVCMQPCRLQGRGRSRASSNCCCCCRSERSARAPRAARRAAPQPPPDRPPRPKLALCAIYMSPRTPPSASGLRRRRGPPDIQARSSCRLPVVAI